MIVGTVGDIDLGDFPLDNTSRTSHDFNATLLGCSLILIRVSRKSIEMIGFYVALEVDGSD